MPDTLCYQILKASNLYKKNIGKNIKALGITYPQLVVMKEVNKMPGITASEILQVIESDKATLSGIIYRLTRDGYITVIPLEKDKRVKQIFLTDKSKKLCEQIQEIETSCMKEILQGIDEIDGRIFVNVLNKIIENQLIRLGE